MTLTMEQLKSCIQFIISSRQFSFIWFVEQTDTEELTINCDPYGLDTDVSASITLTQANGFANGAALLAAIETQLDNLHHSALMAKLAEIISE